MLEFFSASIRSVNSERAVNECIEVAFPDGIRDDCRVIIFNATLGHRLDKVAAVFHKAMPAVSICGASGSAVTGREGIGESMHELGIMAVCGPENEVASAAVSEIYAHNSYEKSLELAKSLKSRCSGINIIYLLCPGIDINNELVLKAFDETFGKDVEIFGGTASDNMRGQHCYQYHDNVMSEHDAFAVGFADPTLFGVARATHGFVAYGEPIVVTKSEGHLIHELDGRGAWTVYTERLGIAGAQTCYETIPTGALAAELPPELAEEYYNTHILRAVAKRDGEAIYYPMNARDGLKLWLTTRDEELIFSGQRQALDYLLKQIGGGKPVAVFQTDCLARGRYIFNRVVKDEMIAMMHDALSTDGVVPAWLGNYGFGEYTKLGGENEFHNYCTALLAVYRK